VVEALQPGIYRLLLGSLFAVHAVRVTVASNRLIHHVLLHLLMRCEL
jgi:hypothetical protein